MGGNNLLRRFFVHTPSIGYKGPLFLKESEAYHAVRVLRMKPGEELVALNGQGDVYTCRVTSTRKTEVALEILNHVHLDPFPWRLTLFQALPKGKLMDDIVQKATELGVYRIVPLITQRTEVKLTEHDCLAKLEKWNTTAREACKQCGGPWLPKIEMPYTLSSGIKTPCSYNIGFVASLEAQTQSFRFWFEKYQKENADFPKDISLWVGPEGDFLEEEYSLLRQNRVLPVTLGPLVLRCETAAIAGLAVILAECRERFEVSKTSATVQDK